MKLKLIYVLLIFFLSSCKTWQASGQKNEYKAIETHSNVSDNHLDNLISPFKTLLDRETQKVIGILGTPLELKQPESTLGNHVADIVLKKGAEYSGLNVDFSVVNFGGIRIGALAAGDLKIENAYQVMPFDNYLVVMEVNGSVVKKLFDLMALAGGWPLSGARFEISDSKPHNIYIGENQFDSLQNYSLVISDYIANGGDKCPFLEGIPYTNTGVFFRDAIIDYWKSAYEKQDTIKVYPQNRVVIQNK